MCLSRYIDSSVFSIFLVHNFALGTRARKSVSVTTYSSETKFLRNAMASSMRAASMISKQFVLDGSVDLRARSLSSNVEEALVSVSRDSMSYCVKPRSNIQDKILP